jgi:SAM-dependent methyltransferase
VGVDIEPKLVEDARREAAAAGLTVEFVESDALALRCDGEFDAVLSMADGAIGYFADDADNLRLFDVIARALRPGGKHLMATCSAAHARAHFPKRAWQAGRRTLSLADFGFRGDTSRMVYRGHVLRYGEPLPVLSDTFGPEDQPGTRLYDLAELREILAVRGLRVFATYGGYDQSLSASADHLMQVVCSRRDSTPDGPCP